MAQSLQVKKLNETHLAIMDRLILNPTMTRSELAREMNITRTHLSVIINSDAFKAAMSERRNEIHAPVLASLREKLTALADSTLDQLLMKVEEGGDLDTLNKVLKTATGSLGMGAPQGGVIVNAQTNNFNGADKETLEAARRVLKQVQAERHKQLGVVEGEYEDRGTHD